MNGSPVGFINGTANALDRFVVSGGLGTSQNAHIDDISLTSGGLNPALFFDDFESYAEDAGVTTAGPWAFTGGTAAARTARGDSSGTPFGGNNQYLEMDDANTSDSIRMQSPNFTEVAGAVSTFSFDFYEETNGGPNSLIAGYATNGDDLNGAGRRQVVRLSNGTISTVTVGDDNTYDLDTAYTLYMIFNDSGSSFDYEGGTINASEAHVWIEELDSGNFVFVGTSSAENAADTAYRVGFRTFTSNIQSMLVDNVELSLGAVAVPEPTSLALLGLGGLLIARRRR